MIVAAPASRVTVRAARCCAARPVRRRVLEAIEGMDTATGLPAPAILVVRRLEATIGGDPPRIRRHDLAAVARDAARPATAPPPRSALAVVFADEVELLTCLAEDVQAGRTLGWWWQSLFDPRRRWGNLLPVAAAVTVAFTEHVVALPAVAARRPLAVSAAASVLDAAVRWRLLTAAAQAYAAPEVVIAARRPGAGAAAGQTPSGGHRDMSMAGRDPGALRGPTVTGDAGGPDTSEPAVLDTFVTPLATLFGWPVAVGRQPSGSGQSAVADHPARRSASGRPRVTDGEKQAYEADEPRPAPDGPDEPQPARGGRDELPPAPEGPRRRRGPMAGGPAEPASENAAIVTATDVEPTEASPPSEPLRWRTAYAGGVYLLTLLERLDLPACADGPGEPGPWLSRWEVMELLAVAVGADRADGLFAALAVLGADSAAAGARWSAAIGAPAPWVYRTPPAAVARLGAQRAPVAEAMAANTTAPDPTDPALRWAHSLAALCAALLDRVGLDWSIIACDGVIEVDDLRVTIAIRLDDIHIGVRRAGLDRNPGWVPALGRIVTLEFW